MRSSRNSSWLGRLGLSVVRAGAACGQRGVTMIEVMMSVLILVIGMLGLMKVASVVVTSNAKGRKINQAGARAQARLEALRNVPTATLACLSGGGTPAACLTSCTSAGGEAQSCQMALGLDADSGTDTANTAYTYGFLVTQVNSKLYDILVVATFQDDSVTPPRNFRTVFRTAVYR